MKRASLVLVLFVVMAPFFVCAEDITLFKHAYRKTAPPPPPDGQYTRYRVKQGDTLKKIFLRDFGARPEDLPALFRKFQQYNPRVRDLNRIVSDYHINIPLAPPPPGQKARETAAAGPAQPAQIPTGNVIVIKKGQHLAKVLKEMYGLSDEAIFHQYIEKIKKLNPDIEDLNLLVEGQKVKLPVINPVPQAPAAQTTAAQVKPQTSQSAMPRKLRIVELKGNTVLQGAAVPREELKAPAAQAKKVDTKTEETGAVAVQQAPPAGNAPQADAAASKAEATAQAVSQAAADARAQEAKAAEARAQAAKAQAEKDAAAAAAKARADEARDREAIEVVQGSLLPAFGDMGYRERKQGTYFLPVAGDRIVSIDTAEVPIIDLDMGKRIIVDVNNKISPETRKLIEQAYPNTRVVSGPAGGKESLMERLLDACGYFSVNRDAGPVLVGEDEKVRLFGKWVIYKDKSRRSVIVINMLADDEYAVPDEIRDYASRFGIRLVEMGGKRNAPRKALPGGIKGLGQSYEKLFAIMGVSYEKDKVLNLVSLDAMKIAYTAPILVGKTIIADEAPDRTMSEILRKSGYRVVEGRNESLGDVLDALNLSKMGPPVRIVIAKGRAELDLPAVQVNGTTILEHQVDREIVKYLTSSGMKAIVW
jgi:hypothetical protein